jgi:hypothetical protein
MSKYRKKPVVIEAVQFDEQAAWDSFLDKKHVFGKFKASGRYHAGDREIYQATLTIPTLEGHMRAELGDWIIKGVAGEFYPCKPEIFAATYDPAEPTPEPAQGSQQK